jgi:hypothetical protein
VPNPIDEPAVSPDVIQDDRQRAADILAARSARESKSDDPRRVLRSKLDADTADKLRGGEGTIPRP